MEVAAGKTRTQHSVHEAHLRIVAGAVHLIAESAPCMAFAEVLQNAEDAGAAEAFLFGADETHQWSKATTVDRANVVLQFP